MSNYNLKIRQSVQSDMRALISSLLRWNSDSRRLPSDLSLGTIQHELYKFSHMIDGTYASDGVEIFGDNDLLIVAIKSLKRAGDLLQTVRRNVERFDMRELVKNSLTQAIVELQDAINSLERAEEIFNDDNAQN